MSKAIFLIISLAIFLFSYLFGQVYDFNILKLQAKVFPKIILMDKNIKDKVFENKIIIEILYEDIDENIAEKLKQYIVEFNAKLNEYDVVVKLINYSNFDINEDATAYFFMLGDKDKIISITNEIFKKSCVTFAYDSEYLDYGIILSLNVAMKTSPSINITALKKSKIEFQNSLFKIAIIK